MKSTMLPSCTCWSSSGRKASKLPSPQVFPPAPSFQDLEFIFELKLLAAYTILARGCHLIQFGDKSSPSRGSGRERGGAPCSASRSNRGVFEPSPARLGHTLLCHVQGGAWAWLTKRSEIHFSRSPLTLVGTEH